MKYQAQSIQGTTYITRDGEQVGCIPEDLWRMMNQETKQLRDKVAELEAELAVYKKMVRGHCDFCAHCNGETFDGGIDCALPYEECEDPFCDDNTHPKWELIKAKEDESR